MRFFVGFYRLVLFGTLAMLLVGAGFFAARYADRLQGRALAPSGDVLVRLDLHDRALLARSAPALAKAAPPADLAMAITPEPSPTPSREVAASDSSPASTQAPQVPDTSIFSAGQHGSLACRIPGGNEFLVEWDAGRAAAVAHFSGVEIPGSMAREREPASNLLDSRVEFSREQDGHRFSMTIDDAGAMRASVDGRESTGSCNRV